MLFVKSAEGFLKLLSGVKTAHKEAPGIVALTVAVLLYLYKGEADFFVYLLVGIGVLFFLSARIIALLSSKNESAKSVSKKN